MRACTLSPLSCVPRRSCGRPNGLRKKYQMSLTHVFRPRGCCGLVVVVVVVVAVHMLATR